MTPEEANKKRIQDEAVTELGATLPALWWSIYSGCMREGFSEGQALELVKAFINQWRAENG